MDDRGYPANEVGRYAMTLEDWNNWPVHLAWFRKATQPFRLTFRGLNGILITDVSKQRAAMQINLPDDIANLARQQAAAAGFPDAIDEYVVHLLTSGDLAEQSKLKRWNERNKAAIEQSQQGLSRPLDDDQVIGRLKARLAENESQH